MAASRDGVVLCGQSSHPTMKPVGLVEQTIQTSTKSHDAVLDGFDASVTTIIASERIGR